MFTSPFHAFFHLFSVIGRQRQKKVIICCGGQAEEKMRKYTRCAFVASRPDFTSREQRAEVSQLLKGRPDKNFNGVGGIV
jgi:hypothetical protein